MQNTEQNQNKNNKRQQQMFDYNQYSFQFPEFVDDFKHGSSQLPTTTHNSPGSMKSHSLRLEDSPFNCSFDEGSQSGHAQAVWEASVKFLSSAVKEFVDLSKGMNDSGVYNVGSSSINVETVEQLVMKNTLLKIQQRHQLLSCFINESQLMRLMQELSSLFNEQIFHEMTYVIYRIWQKKSFSQKEEAKIRKQEQEYIIPHFDCFWGYEDEEVMMRDDFTLNVQKSYADVVASADKCVEEIAEELYFDNRLKLLNLRDCHKAVSSQIQVSALFGQFFKSIAHSVYLSSQGFFNHPSQQNAEKFLQQDFNTNDIEQFEFNEVSALEQFEQSQNKFVRSFSQCLEDDDDEFDFLNAPNKKRKLQ